MKQRTYLNVKLVVGDTFALTQQHRQNHTHTEGVGTHLGLSSCRPLLNNPELSSTSLAPLGYSEVGSHLPL